MPVPGGTTLKSRNDALAPAQERVALAVALELELDVAREREPRGELVDLHRVVDHELGRDQRVDLRRVAAEVGHRVPHRREVDDGRHAGEVLQQHARRARRRSPATARPARPSPRPPDAGLVARAGARSRAGPAACTAGARRRTRPAARRAGRCGTTRRRRRAGKAGRACRRFKQSRASRLVAWLGSRQIVGLGGRGDTPEQTGACIATSSG